MILFHGLAFFPHRTCAACLAMAFRCSDVSFFMRPAVPSLPNATPMGFFFFCFAMMDLWYHAH